MKFNDLPDCLKYCTIKFQMVKYNLEFFLKTEPYIQIAARYQTILFGSRKFDQLDLDNPIKFIAFGGQKVQKKLSGFGKDIEMEIAEFGCIFWREDCDRIIEYERGDVGQI
ncbi:unnamed protein product (macronuclear) [Paramecium tetraurelia]|uniref:Uncharacterized protein n=1 Tax=Paramecium tetraurelia TaxID=5888 RepID=A0C446_PARTE|nr:uncharacterized protein GSPATT00035043001 [Paramecium tetraurelia]CAK65563.1 unnamed protein product [Paramecium tetraurelia]|eukprot:XP_001432960.1 hypothetical protein (macronuclear) [Paramecium tetraurelia strain d4-2]